MPTEEEGTFKVGDVSLYTKSWAVRPNPPPLLFPIPTCKVADTPT